MNYEQVETDIVNRLAPFMPFGVDVMKLPETENDLNGKPFRNGRITVCYKGSDFGDGIGQSNPLRSTAQTVQQEQLQIEIVVQSRLLRTGNDSGLKLIQLVKRALAGFKPTHCDRMHLIKQLLLPDDKGGSDIYTFVQSFECTSLVVEEFDSTSEDIAVITQITVIDEANGNIQVP